MRYLEDYSKEVIQKILDKAYELADEQYSRGFDELPEDVQQVLHLQAEREVNNVDYV